MNWLYISPHLDDAVFSCGGLIWEQVGAGQAVEVWTICAGDALPGPLSAYASSLHTRWGAGPEAAALRREEDRQACRRLGAGYRHFSYPDAIYRRDPQNGEALYTSDEDLFRPLASAEHRLVEELSLLLKGELPPDWQLVCPITLGNHVDHQLVRAAVERAVTGRLGQPVWYYADLPYVLKYNELPMNLVAGMKLARFPVSQAGLAAWLEAAAAYASQISTFWASVEAMRADLSAYCRESGGVPLRKS